MESLMNWLSGKIGKHAAKAVLYLILLFAGVAQKEIEAKYGASPTTLSKYNKAIKRGDLSSILEPKHYRPANELDNFAEIIERAIAEKKPKSRREVQDIIKAKTGIERSLNRIGGWLKKRGSEIWQ